jgi:hypothetical protein
MQIAGNACKICGRKIVFSNEGKFCANCGTSVHLGCEPEAKCDVCNQPLQHYEPPRADLLGQAILPPALRPAKSAGPMLTALLLLVSVLFFLIVLFFLE